MYMLFGRWPCLRILNADTNTNYSRNVCIVMQRRRYVREGKPAQRIVLAPGYMIVEKLCIVRSGGSRVRVEGSWGARYVSGVLGLPVEERFAITQLRVANTYVGRHWRDTALVVQASSAWLAY